MKQSRKNSPRNVYFHICLPWEYTMGVNFHVIFLLCHGEVIGMLLISCLFWFVKSLTLECVSNHPYFSQLWRKVDEWESHSQVSHQKFIVVPSLETHSTLLCRADLRFTILSHSTGSLWNYIEKKFPLYIIRFYKFDSDIIFAGQGFPTYFSN